MADMSNPAPPPGPETMLAGVRVADTIMGALTDEPTTPAQSQAPRAAGETTPGRKRAA